MTRLTTAERRARLDAWLARADEVLAEVEPLFPKPTPKPEEA